MSQWVLSNYAFAITITIVRVLILVITIVFVIARSEKCPCPMLLGRTLDPLADLERSPRFVIGQSGQSLDGRVALPSGLSRGLNSAVALDHLHRLRSLVDGVLVGVGTILIDDPQLNVRRVAGKNPDRIIIDRQGRLPAGARCLLDRSVRRFIVTARQDYFSTWSVDVPEDVVIIALPDRAFLNPATIIEKLREYKIERLLVEGGPITLSHFLASDCIDRLHLLVSPLLLGAGRSGIELATPTRLADALRPKVLRFDLGDGETLFDCRFHPLADQDE